MVYTSRNKNDTDDTKKKKTGGFQSLGLSPSVFRGVMSMGYKVPTPIQRKSLPIVLSGRDVVAMARTGSGKTAAFLIPMFEKLKEHSSKIGVRAVVLAPTRELATQTMNFAKSMSKFSSLKSTLIVGGDSMEQQFEALSSNPDIIIATPGRLMHLLQEIPDFTLKSVEYLVFDEADRMFEMGFAEQLTEIVRTMPSSRQTLLFSATLPKALAQFARAGLSDPELIRLDLERRISENLKLAFFTLHSDEKPAAFLYLIRDFIPSGQQTIVFAATRHHVEFLHEILKAANIDSSCVYGDMDQTARKINVGKFRAKKTNVLIVTDVAARGIDIPLLENVLNYSFPPTAKLFVHRVGRAARAGRSGTALNFVDPDEVPFMIDLHLFLGRKISNSSKSILNVDKQTNYSLTSMTVDDVHIGTIPRYLLDAEVEHFRELLSRNPQISPLVKVCDNAYKHYTRTRCEPSKQSIRRAKDVNCKSLHPLFTNLIDETSIQKAKYVEKLQHFRPSHTIFEVSTSQQSLKKLNPIVVMMKGKRKEHDKIIVSEAVKGRKDVDITDGSQSEDSSGSQLKKRKLELGLSSKPIDATCKPRISKSKRKAMKKGIINGETNQIKQDKPASFKDEENYIGYMKNEDRVMEDAMMNKDEGRMNKMVNARLEEAILDVNPDEAVAMNDRKRIMHWDSRKKKFINATVKDIRSGSIKRKNESGGRIKNEKVGVLYKKWQERSNRRVVAFGDEDTTSVSLDYRNGKKHRLNNSKAKVKDELQDEQSIRKEEKRKARSRGIKSEKKQKSKRGRGNIRGKTHGAPSRSKAIIRKRK